MSFTDLILLIGTNPLPNFVTAKYFIATNTDLKKIHLVYSDANEYKHTESTKIFAERIKEAITDNNDIFQFVRLEDIENSNSIIQAIQNINFGENTDIHLNFTGGTKAMGIFSLQAVSGFKNKSFSYLSPKTFKLIDQNGSEISPDLRDEVETTIDKIINLHGFIDAKKGNMEEENIFTAADNVFNNMIQENKIDEYLNKKNGGYCRTYFQDENGGLTFNADILKKNIQKKYKINGEFKKVNDSLTDDYRLFDENGCLKDCLPSKNNLKKTLKYLDGLWFENYCNNIIKGINYNLKNVEYSTNIVKTKKDWDDELNFEIDGVFRRGYQLFGISMTTESEKGKCKLKGFEIINRISQIGGDEAKAILITLLPDDKKKGLNDELKLVTGGGANIKVLGKNDIKKETLKTNILNYIEGS